MNSDRRVKLFLTATGWLCVGLVFVLLYVAWAGGGMVTP